MMRAIDTLWNYTDEMFLPAEYELQMLNNNTGTDVTLLKKTWLQKLKEVFNEAGLSIPSASSAQTGGKEGKHTQHLEDVLKELQSVARAHPAATW